MTSMRRTTRRTTSKTTRETREKSKKEQTVRVRKKYLHATRHVPCVDEKIIKKKMKKRFICVFFDRFQGYESHGGLFVLKGVPFPLVEAQLLV